jgi:hypothetical protein
MEMYGTIIILFVIFVLPVAIWVYDRPADIILFVPTLYSCLQ